jgi:hypothetical protein
MQASHQAPLSGIQPCGTIFELLNSSWHVKCFRLCTLIRRIDRKPLRYPLTANNASSHQE